MDAAIARVTLLSRSVMRLYVAKAFRAFADGYVSLLLPIYLLELGMTSLQVGIVATATLLGSGLLTLVVGMNAYRYHYRTLLLAATVLMAGTGLGFAVLHDFWPLLLIAFVGTLNPSSGDVSIFMPLEHAVLSRVATDRKRTAAFARYSLVGSLGSACGALSAALPPILAGHFGISDLRSLQAMFVLYAAIALASAFVYRGLPRALESEVPKRQAPLRQSRKIVYTLAALFSLDAFGGGFIVQSMIALWLYQRFSLSLAAAGTIFFWTSVLTAFSYLVAARLADRIGLVNTMVFTHLPSSLCLVAMAFATDLHYAIAFLLVRSALSQMDVPTRSSYVMAIVPPIERPAAASVTSVPRSLASAMSPLLAGYLLGISSFGWPLIAAAGSKIAYDLLLLVMFRKVRPPEESAPVPPVNS